MFGDGISFNDLATLLRVIREKNLTLQVKITDGEWQDLSASIVQKMIHTITTGMIKGAEDIKLRLFQKT